MILLSIVLLFDTIDLGLDLVILGYIFGHLALGKFTLDSGKLSLPRYSEVIHLSLFQYFFIWEYASLILRQLFSKCVNS